MLTQKAARLVGPGGQVALELTGDGDGGKGKPAKVALARWDGLHGSNIGPRRWLVEHLVVEIGAIQGRHAPIVA